MTPKNLAETLAIQFGYCHGLTNRTLAGIPEDAAFLSPEPGGNNLNWVLGHIASSRNGLLGLLGREPTFDKEKAKCYGRGTAPMTDRGEAVPTAELLAAFNASQDAVLAGLAALTPEMMEAAAPFSPSERDDETVGSLLAGLGFHESYHVGQLGILRRFSGAEGVVK